MGQVTVRKIVEGHSHLLLRVDLLSDGTGELSDYVILSPSDLVPPRQNDFAAFRLMQVWYAMAKFNLTIKVGTVTPSVLWTLAADCDSHTDFRSFGGLIDPLVYTNPQADTDGKLTLTSSGFAPAGSAGTLVFELRKTNRAAVSP